MSQKISAEFVTEKARIVDAPKVPVTVDRTFEIPKGVYVATVGGYLGFLAIMTATFGNPGLIIPMAIFVFFIAAGFGIPMIWTRLAPATKSRPKSYGEFASKGIMTHTGWTSARDATTQVLILPVLILLWGLAVMTIAATI